jgi:uncharacterized HAD superfamily protein
MTKRISFDFDGVLSTAAGRKLAESKKGPDVELWIVTARPVDWNDRVFAVADELKIPHTRIIFTGGRDKWSFIERYNIAVHYDNNPEQIAKIKEKTSANAIIFRA